MFGVADSTAEGGAWTVVVGGSAAAADGGAVVVVDCGTTAGCWTAFTGLIAHQIRPRIPMTAAAPRASTVACERPPHGCRCGSSGSVSCDQANSGLASVGGATKVVASLHPRLWRLDPQRRRRWSPPSFLLVAFCILPRKRGCRVPVWSNLRCRADIVVRPTVPVISPTSWAGNGPLCSTVATSASLAAAAA